MPVNDKAGHAGNHAREHQVKNHAVAVGHFQYQNSGSKRGSCNAGKKSYHSANTSKLVLVADN